MMLISYLVDFLAKRVWNDVERERKMRGWLLTFLDAKIFAIVIRKLMI